MTEENKDPAETEPYVKLRGWRALHPLGGSSNPVANIGNYVTDRGEAAGCVTEVRLYLRSGLVRVTVNNGVRLGSDGAFSKIGEDVVNYIWISGGSGSQAKKEAK